jgi:competence protein ComEC
MKLAPVELFSSFKEIAAFGAAIIVIALFSLWMEYGRYSRLVRFDDAVADAVVLNQYSRQKDGREYQVLKVKLEDGSLLYAAVGMEVGNLKGYRIGIWLKTDHIKFVDYLKGFVSTAYIDSVQREKELRYKFSDYIASKHENMMMQEVFGALFAAVPMSRQLQVRLSGFGISHLLAISGFHLGVLSLLLFWLLRWPYAVLLHRFFPYRHGKRDLFIAIAAVLFAYVLFLDLPPSLLRAYVMLMVGYVMHDRGAKVVSMQTLLITVLLLLALWPKLFFSIGFWLSVAGVFYIFLFLIHFAHWRKWIKFIALHFWVYMMLLPVAIYIFGIFSMVHPLSIAATICFVVFYPLALFLHIFGFAALLDPLLISLFDGSMQIKNIALFEGFIYFYLLLSVLSVRYPAVLGVLFGSSVAVLVSAVYQVA